MKSKKPNYIEPQMATNWMKLSDDARDHARRIIAERPGISLTKIAKLSGICRMTLYRYLENPNSRPMTATIDAISRACYEIEQAWPVKHSKKK